ncbi:MAG: exosortase/archaeosortase family protein [Pseudomonadota bacterium]
MTESYFSKRNLLFSAFILIAVLMCYLPLRELLSTTSNREYYSHILLIPFVSGYLIFIKRKEIYSDKSYSFGAGGVFLLIGIALYATGLINKLNLNQNNYASLTTFSAVILISGAFIFTYSFCAFKKALFPLLFLIFTVPIPSYLMERFIYLLQSGSTEFANFLLTVTGVPFLRDGFYFHLSSMSVEVAKQCSGIRSGLALFITALLAGHLFLKTGRNKIILAVCALPVTMFKNGIRIITLALLGNYVDPRILQSDLHREGGIPFFIVALLLLAPILYFLRKSETKGEGETK